jgi:hypothetical protein
MKRGGVEIEEQIKWWDALETLGGMWGPPNVARGLKLARECRHPDAQWLASLFPGDGEVTQRHMADVMLQHHEDPRALDLSYRLSHTFETLERAAEMGYAPAQSLLSHEVSNARSFRLAQLAQAQGDRLGTFQLGHCLLCARGCPQDMKGIELIRVAAELGDAKAMQVSHSSCLAVVAKQTTVQWYGMTAYSEHCWERYAWLVRAAAKGHDGKRVCFFAAYFLPVFEAGDKTRILHTVGPTIRAYLSSWSRERRSSLSHLLEEDLCQPGAEQLLKLRRVAELHAAMLSRAREAIDCWSVVARRLGVAKDMRVLIAKMAWEEAWHWNGKERKDE